MVPVQSEIREGPLGEVTLIYTTRRQLLTIQSRGL